MSVAEINRRELRDITTRVPMEGGLLDLRMGPCTRGYSCKTCNGDYDNCPGHFGHMVMARPIYHFGFLETVRKVLSCVCVRCSKLKLDTEKDADDIKKLQAIKVPANRLNFLYKKLKGVTSCKVKAQEDGDKSDKPTVSGCGYEQPKFEHDLENLQLKATFKKKPDGEKDNKVNFTARRALEILKQIPDEECKLMGFEKTNRPENFIITVYPVAPPSVRPSVDRPGGLTSEDDLTYQYQQILKANLAVADSISKGNASDIIDQETDILAFYVKTLVKNDFARKSKQKNGRAIKSIRERISGKEGRIRGNLMGKRVDFSARTVISPDPTLALDQLGVPRSIALNLTFPEMVTKLNIDHLQKIVDRGPTEWPGAKFVNRIDGRTFDLKVAKKVHLEYGDVVERHIVDNDYVVFNRQPSLHKMSMMGHRIKVLPYSSFRLNLSVVTPYNADFDGDEMNMHVPQTYETKAEIKEILHVPKQMVSPQANKPVMGVVQDVCVGIRLFTRRDIFLERHEMMHLMMWLSLENIHHEMPEPAILKPRPLWTPKQVMSLFIPEVNIRKPSKDFPKEGDNADFSHTDAYVIIEKGQHLAGHLCANTCGSTGGGLVHITWLEHGPEAAKDFLSTTQRIVNCWFATYCHTVGVCDTIATVQTLKEIEIILDEHKESVKKKFLEAQKGKLDMQPGKSTVQSFEAHVNEILNNARDKSGNALELSVSRHNGIKKMLLAGSKGSTINLCQIIACVGQQNVEGKRIPFGFERRTLPHFQKDDYGPESRGFVGNSYLRGLNPQEFYFHTMGGREGLIDTACKTSETGYIQRKLVKAIEDVMVKYDGTLRDSRGYIVQFLYGEDGMAGEFIEPQKITILKQSNAELERDFLIKDSVLLQDENDEYEHKEEFQRIKRARDELRNIFKSLDEDQYLPVNVIRIIANAKAEFHIKPNHISDLTVTDVTTAVRELLSRLVLVQGKDNTSRDLQDAAIKFFSLYLTFVLSSKRVIQKERLTKEAFTWVIGQIETVFKRAMVHPGEMVGAIAAQSISERTTQMTLNTFHNAGVSSKNVTLGVPRFKEIINKATNIGTPSMRIYLQEDKKRDKAFMSYLKSELEYLTLDKLVSKAEIYYDPDPRNSVIQDEILEYALNIDEESMDIDNLTPWLLRLELDKKVLIDHSLVESYEITEHIKRQINKTLRYFLPEMRFLILTNLSYLDEGGIIRIVPYKRLEMDDEDKKGQMTEPSILKFFEQRCLQDIVIKGVEGIKKVYNKQIPITEIDPITGAIKKIQVKTRDMQGGEEPEWLIETDGSNLKKVMAVEGVNHRKTVTNHIVEVCEVLGIEATRQAILSEIRAVLGVYGIYINYRHLALLCDVMTSSGKIMPINRNGINRIDCGPLRKCSFEETLDMVIEAALFNSVDKLTGISENIMLGQLCRLGTGTFDLLVDKDQVCKAKYIPDRNVEVEIRPATETHEVSGPRGLGDRTPFIENTPFHRDWRNTTPGEMNTPRVGGEFTPFVDSSQSPFYAADRGHKSPAYMSKASPRYSPMASPGLALTMNSPYPNAMATSSPGYSPSNSVTYNPTSPQYNASTSPSISSSGAGTRIYSPRSPTYSLSSPKYSPSYSPRSPTYSQHSSTTPSSQNPLTGAYTQTHTPLSPSYNRGNLYNPVSPSYEHAVQNQIQEEEAEESEEEEEEEEGEK
eukprot:CAMPEP_0176430784 /NCGR_PEP_ID=MMETSP0127-20121128/14445_1 /TAXON_ID=938130 /ORGANISM="Platyophrya macrostoma, Strain WH" /LENGTH=1679 /DNA_ID=CAMNT_0017812711 /DNA_START=110 /DNA_END=5149 /DNA_ORIENTATION=+